MAKQNSNRLSRSERRQAERTRQRWVWIGAGVLGVLAVVGVIGFWPRTAAAPLVSAARQADDPTLGPANAPLTLVEYGDFG